MTYREKLAEILGEDCIALAGEWVGGTFGCPFDAFDTPIKGCVTMLRRIKNEHERCKACWDREYKYEDYKKEYWE